MAWIPKIKLPRVARFAFHSNDIPEFRIFEDLGVRVARDKGAEYFQCQSVVLIKARCMKQCCTQSRVRVSREPTWDLVKMGEVGTSSDGLGFYRKSIRIFARIPNPMADSNYLTISKSY